MRDYSEFYLEIAKEIGISDVFTVGTRLSEISPCGKAMGYGTNEDAIKLLEKNNVELMRNEIAPYFSNVILGVASEYFDMTDYRINSNHGEEPPYEDSIKQILEILEKISGIGYDDEVFDNVINNWCALLKLVGTVAREIIFLEHNF